MRMAQGGFRRKPDGYIHLNNFSNTKHSGILGAVYNICLDKDLQGQVEGELIRNAANWEYQKGELEGAAGSYHQDHEVWRFRKDFLKDEFKRAVLKVLHNNRKTASFELMRQLAADIGGLCGE